MFAMVVNEVHDDGGQLSTLTDRAHLEAELYVTERENRIKRCKAFLKDEVYNLKQRRASVDNAPIIDDHELESEDTEATFLEVDGDVDDELVDAYLDLIVEAWAQREEIKKLSDTDWLHLRTFISTYVYPHGMAYEVTNRFRDYLTLLDGDVKLLSKLFGQAIAYLFQPPEAKVWDPRIKVTENEISITFFWKSAGTD